MFDISKARKADRFKIVDGEIHKCCTWCKEFKNLEDFTKAKNTIDKRTPNCSACRNAIPQDKQKKRQSYKENGSVKKAEYYQTNKERIHSQRNERRKNDKSFQLLLRLRKSIRKNRLKKKMKKDNKSMQIIGCDKEFLLAYLIKTFETNYKIRYRDEYFDDLHIDHIIPISTIISLEDEAKLNHYTNLQFLHKDHNLEKKARTDYVIPPYPSEIIDETTKT